MSTQSILSLKPLGFPWETQDPFLFSVHHLDFYPKGNPDFSPAASLEGRSIGQDFQGKDGWSMYHGSTVPGFPAHPHRGFETITVVLSGMVDHADSTGAAGRFGNGDVQWMTAGKGVQHSEMFPLLNQEGENPLELFQIWINLPKKSKMVEPHFKMLWGDQIPVVHSKDAKGLNTEVIVVAGEVAGERAPAPPPDSWAAALENDVAVLRIKMDAGASWTLPAATAGVNRTLYFFRGKDTTVAGLELDAFRAIELKPDDEILIENGSEEGHFLVLQGKPIAEPVAQYGPFVMNTEAEIREAYADFRRTEFGGWPWGGYDPVHKDATGRFAKHGDGRVETR